jgi:hypothetical protein
MRAAGRDHEISPSALSSALAPYEAGIAAAKSRGADEAALTDHERLAIGLVALGNQERMLALEIMAERAASPVTVQALLRNAEALGEGRGATADSAISAAPKPRSPSRSHSAPHISCIGGSASCAFSPIGSATGSRCCL